MSSAKFKDEARRVIYPLLGTGEHLKFVDLAWSERLLDAAAQDRSLRSRQEWKGAFGVTQRRVIWSNPYGRSVGLDFADIEWVRDAKVSRPGSKWLALGVKLSPGRVETARFMMKNASVDEAIKVIDSRRRELIVERRRAAERAKAPDPVPAPASTTPTRPATVAATRAEDEVVFHPDMDDARRRSLQRSLDIMKVQHRWDGPRLLVPKSHEEGALRALEYLRAVQPGSLPVDDANPAASSVHLEETPVEPGGVETDPSISNCADDPDGDVLAQSANRIEERLKALKALHEKGLISDEDLSSRRTEILRDL